MLKIIRIQKATEGDYEGKPEFVLHIPPEYMAVIIQAGMNALVNLGAVQFIQMTEAEFSAHPVTPTQKMSPAEEQMWKDFLQSAPSKDLPQA